MKKLAIITALVLLSVSYKGFAQTYPPQVSAPEHKFNPDNIYFGGSFGASFGSNFTFVEASPLVGYRFTKRFTAGVGATYMYLKSTYVDYYNDVSVYQTSIYGGRVFGRFFFTDNIFGHVEEEVLNGSFYDPVNTSYDIALHRRTIAETYIGPGYMSRFGPNSGIFILLLYNVTSTPYTKQINASDPILLRVGLQFGL